MAIYKPQAPIEDLNGNQVHPITSASQVIMDDGVTRLNAAIDDCVTVNELGTQVKYRLNGTTLTIIPTYGESTGGFGADFNFEIVGGVNQPASPNENTIWVNTDTEIEKWQFSASAPTTRGDGTELKTGDVWLEITGVSNTKLNILSTNAIYVYIIYVYVYTDGSWANTPAYLYQDSTWKLINSDIYLYLNGNEHTRTTGGWQSYAYGYHDASNFAPTLTKDATTITATMTTQSGSNGWGGTVAIANDLDLTNVNSIEFTATNVTAATYRVIYLIVYDRSLGNMGGSGSWSAPERAAAYIQLNANNTTTTTYTLDTRLLSGNYAVGLFLWSAASAGTFSITLSSVKLVGDTAVNPKYIYDYGTTNTALIGGLTAYAYRPSTSSSTATKPTVTTSESFIKLALAAGGLGGSYFTNNAVDLTNYTTMYMEIKSISDYGDSNYIRFGASATKANNYVVAKAKTMTNVGLWEVDISELTGNHYLFVNLYGNEAKNVSFSKWWLE